MRSSHRRTTAASVAKKLTTRGTKKAAKRERLKNVYCAPEKFVVQNIPKGHQASLDWNGQKWIATVDHITVPLTTFFMSPRSAKEDPEKFERQALALIDKIRGGWRPAGHQQKGPLALGVRA